MHRAVKALLVLLVCWAGVYQVWGGPVPFNVSDLPAPRTELPAMPANGDGVYRLTLDKIPGPVSMTVLVSVDGGVPSKGVVLPLQVERSNWWPASVTNLTCTNGTLNGSIAFDCTTTFATENEKYFFAKPPGQQENTNHVPFAVAPYASGQFDVDVVCDGNFGAGSYGSVFDHTQRISLSSAVADLDPGVEYTGSVYMVREPHMPLPSTYQCELYFYKGVYNIGITNAAGDPFRFRDYAFCRIGVTNDVVARVEVTSMFEVNLYDPFVLNSHTLSASNGVITGSIELAAPSQTNQPFTIQIHDTERIGRRTWGHVSWTYDGEGQTNAWVGLVQGLTNCAMLVEQAPFYNWPWNAGLASNAVLSTQAWNEAQVPVMAGEPGETGFWTWRLALGGGVSCIHPPAFDLKEVGGAAGYRFDITQLSGGSFEGQLIVDKPWHSLAPIWAQMPPHPNWAYELTVTPLDANSNAIPVAMQMGVIDYDGNNGLYDVTADPIVIQKRPPFTGALGVPTRTWREGALWLGRVRRDTIERICGRGTAMSDSFGNWNKHWGDHGFSTSWAASTWQALAYRAESRDPAERQWAEEMLQIAISDMRAHIKRAPLVPYDYQQQTPLGHWAIVALCDAYLETGNEAFRELAILTAQGACNLQVADGSFASILGMDDPAYADNPYGSHKKIKYYWTFATAELLYALGRVRRDCGTDAFYENETRAYDWAMEHHVKERFWPLHVCHSASQGYPGRVHAVTALYFSRYLLECAPESRRDIALAEQVARWAEDYRVNWLRQETGDVVYPRIEKGDRYNNGALVGNMMGAITFAELGQATGDALWSAKGEALAIAALSAISPDGSVASWSMYANNETADNQKIAHNSFIWGWAAQLMREYSRLRAMPNEPPFVQKTMPAHGATVATPDWIEITFSKDIEADAAGTLILTNLTLNSAVTYAMDDPAIVISNDVLTVTPDPALSDFTRYAVLISTNAVRDTNGLCFAGIADTNGWTFTTTSPDVAAPLALSFSPLNGATDVPADTTLRLAFDEEIYLHEAGSITMTNLTLGSSTNLGMSADEVVADGTNLVVSGVTLDSASDYAVLITTNAVRDLAGNIYTGIVSTSGWAFRTDDTVPTLVALDPGADATGLDIDTNLVMTFSEPIAVTAEYLVITNLTDGGAAMEIYLPGGEAIVNGSNLVVDPVSDLQMATSYAVLVPSGAIRDLSGNAYAGITATNTWSFRTRDVVPRGGVYTMSEIVWNESVRGNVTSTVDDVQIINRDSTLVAFVADNVPYTNFVFSHDNALSTNAGIYSEYGVDPVTEHAALADDRLDSGTENIGNNINFYFPATPMGSLFESVFCFDFGNSQNSSFQLIDDAGAGLGNSVTIRDWLEVARMDEHGAGSDRIMGSMASFSEFGIATNQLQNVAGVRVGSSSGLDPMLIGFTGPFEPNWQDPVAESLSPLDDALVLAPDVLEITFSDAIVTNNTGNVIITNLTAGSADVIPAGNPRLSIDSHALTITPSAPLDASTDYAVLIDSNLIKNAGGLFFAGFASATNWNFTTAAPDLTAPTVDVLSPADNSVDVPVDAVLQIAFSEDVIADGAGSITLSNMTASTAVVFPATNAAVTVSSNVVTLIPPGDLAVDADYCVLIDANALRDASDNYFAGIADAGSWDFRTAPDTTAPVIVTLFPARNATGVAVGTNLTVTFSETITTNGGDGTIMLTNLTEHALVESFGSGSSRLTVDGASLTIDPAAELASNGTYAVLMGTNVVFDLHGNAFAGITSTQTWFFTPELGFYVWNTNAAPLDGTVYNWNNPTNWTGKEGFPNAPGDIAVISGDITADTDILLNESITIGSLTIEDLDKSSLAGIEIEGGGGALTFDNGGHAAEVVLNIANTDEAYLRSTITAVTLNDSLEITLTDGNLEIDANVGESMPGRSLKVVENGAGQDCLVLGGTCTYTGPTVLRGQYPAINGTIAGDFEVWASTRCKLANGALSADCEATIHDGYLYQGNNTIRNLVTKHTGACLRDGELTVTGAVRPGGTNAVGVLSFKTDNKPYDLTLTGATLEVDVEGTGSYDTVYGEFSTQYRVHIDGCEIDIREINGFAFSASDVGLELVVFDELGEIHGTPTITAPGDQNWSFATRAGDDAGLVDGVLTLVGTGATSDTDGDGMDDAWEVLYFGNTNVSAGIAQDDQDSDGFTDLHEFIAGTHPMNSNSLLRVTATLPETASSFVLEWPSVSGRRYSVWAATSLSVATPWSALPDATNLPGTGSPMTYTNNTPSDVGFYRLKVRLE